MYSPRSVSTVSMPSASSAALSPISSEIMDLPLVTDLAPASRHSLRIISARLGGIARPMNMASRRDDLPLVFFEIDVEVIEHMVLDIDRDCAQPVELGQGGARFGALGDEPRLDIAQCALELRVAKRA